MSEFNKKCDEVQKGLMNVEYNLNDLENRLLRMENSQLLSHLTMMNLLLRIQFNISKQK